MDAQTTANPLAGGTETEPEPENDLEDPSTTCTATTAIAAVTWGVELTSTKLDVKLGAAVCYSIYSSLYLAVQTLQSHGKEMSPPNRLGRC